MFINLETKPHSFPNKNKVKLGSVLCILVKEVRIGLILFCQTAFIIAIVNSTLQLKSIIIIIIVVVAVVHHVPK